MSDNQLTVLIFSLFVAAPFLSAALDYYIDKAKDGIDARLAKHGLRLKRR